MEKIYNAFEKAKNDKCNAIVTLVEPKENLNKGKLSGEPIILKDNISTKGIRTTASSKILDNYYPIFDSTVVEKIKSEGGVIIGKASMDELAMGGTNLAAYTGPVLNPWDYKRMSGGSSGGSAAVVSSGIVSFAIGSDTGDSVRKPASFCGIVGVKPTYGRISRYGVVAYASSLDHVGYFTRNVKDASLMLEVLAGRDDKDMTSSFKEVKEYSKLLNSDVKGKKIAVFKNVIDSLDNENTINLFNDLLNKLKEKGAIIEEVSFDNDLMRTLFPVYFIIANCEATSNHSNLDGLRFGVSEDGDDTREVVINSRTKGFGSLIRKRFVIGSFGLHEENQEKVFKKAQRIRRLIVEEVKKCLEEYDCLIAPASNDIAPLLEGNKIDELSDKYLIAENHMVIGNFTGYPSMTVPMGFEKGCPIGVNITCKAFDEENMFNIGLAIEESTGLKDLVAKVD
ncbi:MAG: amidase family protein [Bacillota bacterium]|nr:amidase family protein [Bacillota bacterium]